MTRSRSLVLALVALLTMALPVLASVVTPRQVDSATSCGPLTPGTVELLVDATSLPAGTVSKGEFTADVTLEGTVETGSVAFRDASLPVKSAFVAGATSGNLYEYPDPVRSDEGLVAPDGQPIVSVSFCYITDAVSGESAAESGNGGTPPATDTVPVATGSTPASSSIALVVLGLGCLVAAAVLVVFRRRSMRR